MTIYDAGPLAAGPLCGLLNLRSLDSLFKEVTVFKVCQSSSEILQGRGGGLSMHMAHGKDEPRFALDRLFACEALEVILDLHPQVW